MKEGIHPEFKNSQVICACGVSFETRGATEKIHVDICSECHPFYTGKEKIVDTEGRVEKFRKKYAQNKDK